MTDPHSYARPAEARVTSVGLDLRADFTRKVLEGTATLTRQAAAGARELVLDTRGLEIQGVAERGAPLTHALGAPTRCSGARLTVALPATAHRRRALPHVARRRGAAVAVAAQTAGGTHPYLFSQGQAILTRTWIPTQDSPASARPTARASWSPRRCAP